VDEEIAIIKLMRSESYQIHQEIIMTTLRLLVFTLVICFVGGSQRVVAQNPTQTDADTAAINALYTDWSKATAERGADGYVSFWVADEAAVLPPDAAAIEGKEAIRQWIQKVLDEYTVKVTSFVPGSLRVANGWATRRFTMSGERVPKKGGEAVKFSYKYLDVLQKQADGSWKFVYRMWSNNEQ
jgi:ketosteroid isomerase-like protein